MLVFFAQQVANKDNVKDMINATQGSIILPQEAATSVL